MQKYITAFNHFDLIYPFGSHGTLSFLVTVFGLYSLADEIISLRVAPKNPGRLVQTKRGAGNDDQHPSDWCNGFKDEPLPSKSPFQRRVWKFGKCDISNMDFLDLKRIHESSRNLFGVWQASDSGRCDCCISPGVKRCKGVLREAKGEGFTTR